MMTKLGFTDQEKRALLHRIQHKNRPWKTYVMDKTNKTHVLNIVNVRKKIENHIKFLISLENSPHVVVCKEGEENEKEVSKDASMVANLENSKLFKDKNLDTPFVLDFGSKNYTSDTDLTIMNYDSLDIIPKILRQLNRDIDVNDINVRFTRRSLNVIFDMTFYLSTFLYIRDGKLIIMQCDSNETIRSQRKHAKFRLKRHKEQKVHKDQNPYTRLSLDHITSKIRDFVACGSCEALEYTSKSTYFIDDAYHSKGAFVHVLLEIQNGVRMANTIDDYLDSSFDNLGLILMYIKNDTFDSAKFCKYGSRIVHALKKINVICNMMDNHENIRIHTDKIINLLNDSSEYDSSKKYIAFSIGKLSTTKKKKNSVQYDFSSVFDETSNAFHIPGRMIKDNLDLSIMMTNLIKYLEYIETMRHKA